MIKKISIILLFLLIVLSFSKTVSSVSPPTVYILNSNRSVVKLFQVEISFKNRFSGKVKSFDLKELGRKRDNIAELIRPAEQDLVYCIGSSALLFALKTYPKNRIIFSSVINWRRFDLTKKTYGVSGEVPLETQITLFKHILPSIKKIGIVYSPKYNQEWFNSALAEAKPFNLKLVGLPYTGAQPVDKISAELFPVVDALWLIPDPEVITRNSFFKILQQSEENKKPLLTFSSAFVENGALLAISIDDETIGRQAAVLVERVINEETIEEKIQRSAGSFVTLNLKKANEFKLKINPAALGNINRIIQ